MKQNLKTILATITMLLALPIDAQEVPSTKEAPAQSQTETESSKFSFDLGFGLMEHSESSPYEFNNNNVYADVSLTCRGYFAEGHGLAARFGVGIEINFGGTSDVSQNLDLKYSYRFATSKRIKGHVSASMAFEGGLALNYDVLNGGRVQTFSMGGVVAATPKIHFSGFDLGFDAGIRIFGGHPIFHHEEYGNITLGSTFDL